MNHHRIIAITGGIGTGKSVVSQLLRIMGYTVYDCDQRAKLVMTTDAQLRQELSALFGPHTYLTDAQGQPRLNKPFLAAQIFGQSDLLAQMNACVHPAVARDMRQMMQQMPGVGPFFFESAILFESGFDKLVPPDEVWTVSAPLQLRIQRAMKRDNATRQSVLQRIESQLPQSEKERLASHIIINDDCQSVIAQVNQLIHISC